MKKSAQSSGKRRTSFHTLLVFRCPTELSERLADVAGHQNSNMSAVIRQLLEDGLRKATH
jgi:predicted DNA-binding protein